MAEASERLSADTGAGRRSPDEIRSEIERTRSEMHETVDALERRLTPGEIFDEVWQRFRGSGGGGGAGEVVREHPVPLALMGLGLGWLAVEKATGNRESHNQDETIATASYGTVGYYEPGTLRAEEEGESKLDKVKHGADSVKEKASELKDKASGAREKASQLGDRASEAGHRASDMASSAGHRVSETASHAADRARSTARRAQDGFDRLSREQPLALGAITFGLGLAAGMMTPTTRWEDEHVGPSSDRLKDTARETAHEAKDIAKEVAHEAKDVARETKDALEQSARETEGRSAGERIGAAVDRAKDTAMHAAEQHHIDREGLKDRGREVAESAKQHIREGREETGTRSGPDPTRL